jgi:hypothetical protein
MGGAGWLVDREEEVVGRRLLPNEEGRRRGARTESKTKDKSVPSPDEECYHYHKKEHWFRNCKKYLEKGSEISASGINVIEINIAVSSSDS